MGKSKTTRKPRATTNAKKTTTKTTLTQKNAKTPGKKFSRASAVNTFKLMVTNGLMTRDEMSKKLALLDAKHALTDGTRSKDVTTQKCFDVSRKAVKAVRNVSKSAGSCAYVDDSGKMVIVYITTAREGSTKYNTLAKSDYANDVRLAKIHHQKRNEVKNAK
tara:strand:+ start:484 stop:969 length:486 start_codon:yes stop_codon:yes gene_type:complete